MLTQQLSNSRHLTVSPSVSHHPVASCSRPAPQRVEGTRLRARFLPAATSDLNGNAPSSSGRDAKLPELTSLMKMLQARKQGPQAKPGDVFLIGTGPGDPGLLTLRALQLMQTADVVLYDRLVSDEVLQLVHLNARMVYVGKQSGFHTRTQDEIHALLLAFAEAGATVIRLKGGDPYVFGRGGEEVQYLAARGIRTHCVPGITAASGICAELGIPMTHRGVATSVRFLTGHSRDGGEEQLEATLSLASDPHTTLVVYMGLGKLPVLSRQLQANGMRVDMPAVAVERGTTSDRRVVYGTIADLTQRTGAAGLQSPTLIVIGDVVALSPGWAGWEAAGRPAEWNEASSYPEFSMDMSAMPMFISSGPPTPGRLADIQALDALPSGRAC